MLSLNCCLNVSLLSVILCVFGENWSVWRPSSKRGRGGVDVGASDERAATVPMRRHHKRVSRCTSPESVCSRLDDSTVRRKPKSSGLAVHSSPGELGPDTAVAHPLLSAFPRRSSSSQPLVPRRERQHSTSSCQLDSDSGEVHRDTRF